MRTSSLIVRDESRPIELVVPQNRCANRECKAVLPGVRYRFCLKCRRAGKCRSGYVPLRGPKNGRARLTKPQLALLMDLASGHRSGAMEGYAPREKLIALGLLEGIGVSAFALAVTPAGHAWLEKNAAEEEA